MILPEGFIQYAQEWEAKINAFIELHFDAGGERGPTAQCGNIHPKALKLIRGFPCAVKDNIAVQNMRMTCGSKLLEQFRPPYSAAVTAKLEAAGGMVIGKTNLDEFGMGSSTANSAFKITRNPWDLSRSAGGSSGGSAAAVAAGIVPYALGTDTGGSIRQPAAFCGIAGLKPTYGAVSRFGLAAYASSLETAGVLADTIDRCRAVFSVIRGRDPRDQTSRDVPAAAPPLYPMAADGNTGAGKKIGVLSAPALAPALAVNSISANNAAVPEAEVMRGLQLARERLAALGHTLVDIEIPGLRYAVPAYYTIACAEAASNLARYDGVRYGGNRYGGRIEAVENVHTIVDETRRAGLGPEVKLRILLGAFVLRSGFQERYYLRAQKIRAGIRAAFETVLGDSEYRRQAQCDAILMPVFPVRAFTMDQAALSPFAQKAADLYTCCANLAGLPALAFPASVEGGIPIGVQLMGRAFAEGTLFDIAETYERQFPFPRPRGYQSWWS